MAVATATATILFTSVASMREHHRHGAILWPVVAAHGAGHHRRLARRPADRRRHVDGAAVGVLRRLRRGRRRPTCCSTASRSPRASCPGTAGLFAVGGGIGLVSSMVGAGGAFLTVPFMTRLQRPACATASRRRRRSGLPIAVAGTIGFVIAGLGSTGCRRTSVGYVYLPALLAIVAASVVSRADRRARRAPLAGADAEAGLRGRCSTRSPPTCCGRPGARTPTDASERPASERRAAGGSGALAALAIAARREPDG